MRRETEGRSQPPSSSALVRTGLAFLMAGLLFFAGLGIYVLIFRPLLGWSAPLPLETAFGVFVFIVACLLGVWLSYDRFRGE